MIGMMADRYMRDQLISIIADRLDFERLRGFCDGQTDGLTDRRTFAIIESLSRLKISLFVTIEYYLLLIHALYDKW